MTPPFTVRPAVPADAPALAHVHTASWQETYTGLMPPDFLARMTDGAAHERRRQMWEGAATDPAQIVLVAEQDGAVIAFASGGPARDHPGVDAELYTLYALKSAHGQGLGRALLHALAQELQAGGARNLALWVLDVNPTRQWYARLGGREAGEKTQAIPGSGELREVRLVWDDLARLR
ncbi:Acetyltransferase [Deinococcus phoenicis]|uniref:Acetyltransferase n=1 Tax=Deinococcus phoenicis TaxID=1476583 RepID=A0A016QTM3_9DEIO|nr:GNAT family N-acetyltransferase [Deinococcus phoenicis]EYB69418.1 Acetyltransferase [Deinococcus phoenicis]